MELSLRATTLPLKTANPSFWRLSRLSEFTVTGAFLPSVDGAEAEGTAGRGLGAVGWASGERARTRAPRTISPTIVAVRPRLMAALGWSAEERAPSSLAWRRLSRRQKSRARGRG